MIAQQEIFHPPHFPDTRNEFGYNLREHRDWLVVTEMVRREIATHNPDILSICSSFADTPLSVELPTDFVAQVAHANQRIETFIQQHQELSGYLTHPLSDSKNERLVQRFVFARDIKLLALASEILQTNIQEKAASGEVNFVLPNGTRILVNNDKHKEFINIMYPEKWESRRQIHDRVFDVTIAGKHYLLKEARTYYHRGLMNHKHPRQTSVAEMQTARDFVKRGTILTNELLLTWEDPICAVEFADGYSFVLFEKEPELLPREEAYELLKAAYMLLHPNDPFADVFVGNIQIEIDRLVDNVILALGYEYDDYAQCLYRVSMIQNRLTLERFGFDFEFFRPMSKRDRKKTQKLLKKHDPQLYGYLQSRT